VSILSVIGLILTAIKYIPELIQIVKAILEFLHNLHKQNPTLADQYVLRLRDAVYAARHGNVKLLQDLAKELGVA
jgi:hypothetical protein